MSAWRHTKHHFLTIINAINYEKRRFREHLRCGRSYRRGAPLVWPHRKRVLPKGQSKQPKLLPLDAQKKTEAITHARVLHLLQQTLTEEEFATLSLAYTRAIVSDEGLGFRV